MGVRAVALLSNGISAAMLRRAIEHDGIEPRHLAVLLARPVAADWLEGCAAVIGPGARPSLTLPGQWRAAGFYARAARALRGWLASPDLAELYLANSDNLLSNHMLRWAERRQAASRPVRVSVLAEGLMNYQEIGRADRAGWRWASKPLAAAALGLAYREPATHLSGAFEPVVSRVLAYQAEGLKAPGARVTVLPFPPARVEVPADPDAVLVVLTGLAQWMPPARFAELADAFAAYVRALPHRRLLVRRHPFYPSGGIEARLPAHTIHDDPRPLEELAGRLPARTLVGTATTALATLSLMRPDLACIDFGSDLYCEHAYHGDRSVVAALRAAGVRIVEAGAVAR